VLALNDKLYPEISSPIYSVKPKPPRAEDTLERRRYPMSSYEAHSSRGPSNSMVYEQLTPQGEGNANGSPAIRVCIARMNRDLELVAACLNHGQISIFYIVGNSLWRNPTTIGNAKKIECFSEEVVLCTNRTPIPYLSIVNNKEKWV
jgi:hypothetical protein